MKSPNPSDERWMRRALALARRGEALAHPNPMVGAVLVRDGQVIGEGFHTWDGVRHAEIIAIESAGRRARGASLYLNLEPCSHSGRTGPCADAILAAGVRRVVVAMKDPNPLVSGRGIEKLRRGGVGVTTGIVADEARALNEDFACWVRRHRPFVTLKSAATLDGQLALARPGEPRRARSPHRWITSEASREFVQHLRHAADAVLTGIGTVLADDPLLTDRTGRPRARPLLRVVVDSRLRLPLGSRLVRTAADDVLVLTLRSPASKPARRLAQRGVRVVRVRGRAGRIDLRAALFELGCLQILNLLVEAGANLNGALLSEGLVDKSLLFYSPRILGRATVPLALAANGAKRSERSTLASLSNIQLHRFGPDFAVEGYLRDVYRDR